MPEILAPVGTPEALEAALATGADAVYLGTNEFNARRNAQNFSQSELPDITRRCHIRGVKLYLALNTLLLESEHEALLDLIQIACEAGIDAVIVQDLGIAAILRRCAPTLHLHASTQMAIHNLEGAKMLEELGFSRVVPARECSAEELEAIIKGTSLEVEVFVHGALCMCVSGQCYMSAMLGGRSGNRGLCAQPCRLPFTSSATDHALSLKDMSLIPWIERLKTIGVHSLKIEGRMKRPEYVAAAVTACRDALAGREVDMQALQNVFSRSGFTDGYFTGERTLSMFGIREKEDVQAAPKVLGQFAALYTDTKRNVQKVPINMLFEMNTENAILTVKDSDGNTVKADGVLPQAAMNKATDIDRVRTAVEKTGGTPYYLTNLECKLEPGLMLPASAINDLRRRALAELDNLRGEPKSIGFKRCEHSQFQNRLHTGKPQLRIDAATAKQISSTMAKNSELIILPGLAILNLPEDSFLWEYKDKLCALLPRMMWKAEPAPKMAAMLKERGITHALVGNLGTLHLAEKIGFTIHVSSFLNALNSEAFAELARIGAKDITLSFETNLAAGALTSPIPLGLTAYGHLPLMTVRNCPTRIAVGCIRCKKGENFITDRKGNRMHMHCVRGSCEIENPVPLYLADRLGELENFDFLTLRFTGETPESCAKIFEEYQCGGESPTSFTRGLLYRPLL